MKRRLFKLYVGLRFLKLEFFFFTKCSHITLDVILIYAHGYELAVTDLKEFLYERD